MYKDYFVLCILPSLLPLIVGGVALLKIKFDPWAMLVTSLIFRSAIFIALLIPFSSFTNGKPVNYLKNNLIAAAPLMFMTLAILSLSWNWVWKNKRALLIFGADFLFWIYLGLTTYVLAGMKEDVFWVMNYFLTYGYLYAGYAALFLLIRLVSYKPLKLEDNTTSLSLRSKDS